MAATFLNGEFLDPTDARVSAADAGILHGVGLFETMSATLDGDTPTVARLHDHLDRLALSAKTLKLSDSIRKPALAEAVTRTAEKAGLPKQRVRLTVTGGDLNLLAQGAADRPHDPTIIITAQPATDYPPAMLERGVTAAIADTKGNPFEPGAGHKTLNYWWRLSELQAAGAKNAAEALVFSITNHLVGGCVSNAFLVKDGALFTPIARGEEPDGGIPSPVLPGITRRAAVFAAQELGIETSSRMLTINDVLGADELFLTNSSWSILPVVAVEASTIGTGAPGEITTKLRDAFRG
ncbi:MAG: aminotransferase class IV [Planctomycetota bacterium]